MSDQPHTAEKTLFVIHTVAASLEPLKEAFCREASSIRLLNLLDEAMLSAPGMTPDSPRARARFQSLLRLADETDPDGVLVACSTYTRVIDRDETPAGKRLFWIDEPMMEEAVRLGPRVGLLATNPDTLAASQATLARAAEKLNRTPDVTSRLDAEAFESLLQGNRDEHDRRVVALAKSLADDVDVVVLAQVSMAHLANVCRMQIGIPVLSSPVPCARAVAKALQENS